MDVLFFLYVIGCFVRLYAHSIYLFFFFLLFIGQLDQERDKMAGTSSDTQSSAMRVFPPIKDMTHLGLMQRKRSSPKPRSHSRVPRSTPYSPVLVAGYKTIESFLKQPR